MAGLEGSPDMTETVVSELTDLPDPRTRACLARPVQLESIFCICYSKYVKSVNMRIY